MKKTKILYIINFILIVFILLSNKGSILNSNRIILKNMTESTQIIDLNKSIETLNTSHTDYSNYIQESKKQIANIINLYPNKNVNENDTFDEFISNINNLTDFPENIYYYVEGTEGTDSIERYKYINGNYYSCNENGIVADGTSATDVSSKTLIEYISSNTGNLSAGTASYINKSLLLGNGSDIYEKINTTPITIKSSQTLANKSTINPYTDTITFTKPKGYTTIELSCINASGSGTKKAYLRDSDNNNLISVSAGSKKTYTISTDECTLKLYTYASADTTTYGCHCYGQVVLK